MLMLSPVLNFCDLLLWQNLLLKACYIDVVVLGFESRLQFSQKHFG